MKAPTGFAIRPARPDDAFAVAELMVAFDRALAWQADVYEKRM